MRIVITIQSLTQKEMEKQDKFSLFFCIVPLDINPLDSMMLKYYSLIMKEGGL